MWALLLTGFLALGTLLYFSLGLSFLICKIGEIPPALQGMMRTEGGIADGKVPSGCSADVLSRLVCPL